MLRTVKLRSMGAAEAMAATESAHSLTLSSEIDRRRERQPGVTEAKSVGSTQSVVALSSFTEVAMRSSRS